MDSTVLKEIKNKLSDMRRRDAFVASTLGEFGGGRHSFVIQIFFIKTTANNQLA